MPAKLFNPKSEEPFVFSRSRIDNFLERSEMESRLLLQVHDELIFETSERHLKNLLKSASDIMEKANLPYLSLDVPLKVEGDHGLNWSKAH